jgi:hypothetical protein
MTRRGVALHCQDEEVLTLTNDPLGSAFELAMERLPQEDREFGGVKRLLTDEPAPDRNRLARRRRPQDRRDPGAPRIANRTHRFPPV